MLRWRIPISAVEVSRERSDARPLCQRSDRGGSWALLGCGPALRPVSRGFRSDGSLLGSGKFSMFYQSKPAVG